MHTPATYCNFIIAHARRTPKHDSSTCSTWPCATKAQGIVADHALASCRNRKQTQTHGIWKIQKLGSNKIPEKAACCNHILSGRKSGGMSHLNQTSEHLWATINSDVSSRNSTHKRFLGSFLLQSLMKGGHCIFLSETNITLECSSQI